MVEKNLELVFIPALIDILLIHEKKKGSPLTKEEVLKIKDEGICIALNIEELKKEFNLESDYSLSPHYNIDFHQETPIIIFNPETQKREIKMIWEGLSFQEISRLT